jgi:hypothetical protein
MLRKPLPPNPSLEFDRKAAKRLLDEIQSGGDDAVTRVAEQHPRFPSNPGPPSPNDFVWPTPNW